MLLYKNIVEVNDYIQLQQDVNSLHSWISEQHISFNVAKCKYLVWDMDYEHLLHVFKLPTLTDLGYYLDMCTLYKMINNLAFVSADFIHLGFLILTSP